MAQRRVDVARARRRIPVRILEQEGRCRKHHSLLQRLKSGTGAGIIAELKKASPSAGLIRRVYRPAAIAKEYAESGAVGISVLTEPHWFLGSEIHLRQVRAAVNLPILRKDFICDPYQIHEAAAWGADVVLVIVAALEASALKDLHATARGLGLEVLVEVHTPAELDAAVDLKDALIGVNSRNLKTLKTDLEVALNLGRRLPAGRICIAESGIRTRHDIERLESAGYRGFLVGESLMRGVRPGETLRTLAGTL